MVSYHAKLSSNYPGQDFLQHHRRLSVHFGAGAWLVAPKAHEDLGLLLLFLLSLLFLLLLQVHGTYNM